MPAVFAFLLGMFFHGVATHPKEVAMSLQKPHTEGVNQKIGLQFPPE